MCDDPLLVTVRRAAELLGLGRDTTYALIAAGTLPALKVGRVLKVPRRALEEFAASIGKDEPGAAAI